MYPQTVISDGTYDPSDWEVTYTSEYGATQTSVQEMAGGNPGAFLHMEHILPIPPNGTSVTRIEVAHIYHGESYNPSIQGAIEYINYSEDIKLLSLPYDDVSIDCLAAVEQEGRIFTSTGYISVIAETTWQSRTLSNLKASNFVALDGSGDHPDFSSSGTDIAFGFFRLSTRLTSLPPVPPEVDLVKTHASDNFTVTIYTVSDAEITVTSPNGGEKWLADSTETITWTSTGSSGNVHIEYSPDNGALWSDITASTPDDGTYAWTIPDTPSNLCLVRISDTEGESSDVSDASFSIFSAPEIMITWPNGGEILKTGLERTITWTSVGTSGYVNIDYSTNYHVSWYSITTSTPNDGSYAWTIPDAGSDFCLVRVSDADGDPSDISDAFFAIFKEYEDHPLGVCAMDLYDWATEELKSALETIDSIDFDLYYRLRDEVLQQTEAGQDFIDFYYKHTQEFIYVSVWQNPQLARQAKYLCLELQDPFRNLLDGDGDAIIPQTIEDTLKALINTLLPLASDSLHDELLEQMDKFGSLDDLAGMSIDSAVTKAIGEWNPTGLQPYSTKIEHGFILDQNYPNPFTSRTSIKYILEKESTITLKIFNISGQEIITLVNSSKLPGEHSAVWNGKDQFGEEVPEGVYYYQLKVGKVAETRKMLLVR